MPRKPRPTEGHLVAAKGDTRSVGPFDEAILHKLRVAQGEERAPLGHVSGETNRQAPQHDVVARLLTPSGSEAYRTHAGLDEVSAGVVATGKPQVENLTLRVGTERTR